MKLSMKLALLNFGLLLTVGALTVYRLYATGAEVSLEFYMTFALTIFAGGAIGYWVSCRLAKNLLNISHEVDTGAKSLLKEIKKVSDHSHDLSDATNEQASNLQQTVASLNEISSMINKNTDASQSSKKLSANSREAAKIGKGTITRMLSSIDEISDANSEIIDQMTKNAAEIQEIISVIREIEDKTLVINDIVFQTKLLSFNASVEAARAGEHGKGFSVVAEEVGKLAQHSGDAAKQIEEMLNQSVQKVENIAKGTESKVKELVQKGTTKVEQGKDVARECDRSLGDILEYANNLDNMIEEIAVASVEQSQGVEEISRAMSELDKVTKQNTIIAHETSKISESLGKEASKIQVVTNTLNCLITGRQDSETHAKELAKHQNKKSSEAFKRKKKVAEAKKAISKADNVIELKAEKNKAQVKQSIEVQRKPSQASVATKLKAKASGTHGVPSASEGEWEDI